MFLELFTLIVSVCSIILHSSLKWSMVGEFNATEIGKVSTPEGSFLHKKTTVKTFSSTPVHNK